MLRGQNVDIRNMYFDDRLGEQHVLKRRRPSPVKKTARFPSEAAFPQEVWPRQAHRDAAPAAGKHDRAWRTLFGKVAPGNVEKPKRRKSAAPNNAAPNNAATKSAAAGGDFEARAFEAITLDAKNFAEENLRNRAFEGEAFESEDDFENEAFAESPYDEKAFREGAFDDDGLDGDGYESESFEDKAFDGGHLEDDAFAYSSAELFGGSSFQDESALDKLRGRLSSLAEAVSPLAKKIAAVAGLLAVGVVALNWDGISDRFAPSQPNISPASLQDPIPPLMQRHPEFFPEGMHWGTPRYWADHYAPINVSFSLTETFYWTPYTVAYGDTISGIAARHSLSQGSIIALNDIRETWNLQAGRTLKIPNMDGIPYAVQANDTLAGIAQSMGIPLEVLLDANDVRDDNITVGQTLFIPGGRMDPVELRRAIWRAPDRQLIRPIAGRITSGFGWRADPFGSGTMELHRAVDLAGGVGDSVRAAMGGTVLHRGATPTMGNFIVLQHGYYQTLYAHLSAFSVREGETVRQGQEVGRVGNTGRTTGPHLHFALFYRGEAINPIDRWRP